SGLSLPVPFFLLFFKIRHFTKNILQLFLRNLNINFFFVDFFLKIIRFLNIFFTLVFTDRFWRRLSSKRLGFSHYIRKIPIYFLFFTLFKSLFMNVNFIREK